MKWLKSILRDTRHDWMREWYDAEVRVYNRKYGTYDYDVSELFI